MKVQLMGYFGACDTQNGFCGNQIIVIGGKKQRGWNREQFGLDFGVFCSKPVGQKRTLPFEGQVQCRRNWLSGIGIHALLRMTSPGQLKRELDCRGPREKEWVELLTNIPLLHFPKPPLFFPKRWHISGPLMLLAISRGFCYPVFIVWIPASMSLCKKDSFGKQGALLIFVEFWRGELDHITIISMFSFFTPLTVLIKGFGASFLLRNQLSGCFCLFVCFFSFQALFWRSSSWCNLRTSFWTLSLNWLRGLSSWQSDVSIEPFSKRFLSYTLFHLLMTL